MPRLKPHQLADLLCRAALTDIHPKELAKKLNIDRSAVYYHVNRAGVLWHRPRYRRLSEEQRREAVERCKAGEPYKRIAESMGVIESTVAHHARMANALPRRKTGRPSKYTGNETHYLCSGCGQTKPADQFYRATNPRTLRKVNTRCKRCCIRARACSELKIRVETYERIHSRGACDICGKVEHEGHAGRTLFIDHNHLTGAVRGLLCEACNSGINGCDSGTDLLDKYMIYLRREPPRLPQSSWAGGSQADYNRYRTYGITPEQFIYLTESGLCGCCGHRHKPTRKWPTLLVDHCHTTGAVRGAICFRCNIALGKFQDSVETIEKAIQYLKNPPESESNAT